MSLHRNMIPIYLSLVIVHYSINTNQHMLFKVSKMLLET